MYRDPLTGPIFYGFSQFLEMDYPNMWWMMITFETVTMLVNLATKLTMTAGLFLVDTQTPVMITVTA